MATTYTAAVIKGCLLSEIARKEMKTVKEVQKFDEDTGQPYTKKTREPIWVLGFDTQSRFEFESPDAEYYVKEELEKQGFTVMSAGYAGEGPAVVGVRLAVRNTNDCSNDFHNEPVALQDPDPANTARLLRQLAAYGMKGDPACYLVMRAG